MMNNSMLIAAINPREMDSNNVIFVMIGYIEVVFSMTQIKILRIKPQIKMKKTTMKMRISFVNIVKIFVIISRILAPK